MNFWFYFIIVTAFQIWVLLRFAGAAEARHYRSVYTSLLAQMVVICGYIFSGFTAGHGASQNDIDSWRTRSDKFEVRYREAMRSLPEEERTRLRKKWQPGIDTASALGDTEEAS